MTRVIDVATQLLSDYPELASAPQPRRSILQPQPVDGVPLVKPNPPREGRWLGPVPLEGDCLQPLIRAGRSWVWVDPSQAPQDGDLVLVHAGPRTMRWLLELGAEDPDWLAKYPTVPDAWGKQFRLVDGLAVLVERQSAFTFSLDMRLLGVIARDS